MANEVTAIILRDWLKIQGGDSVPINVAGLAVARSFSLPMVQDVSFGWLFQFASPGAIDVQIDLEQSNDRPATEKAADANYVIPEGVNPIITISDSLVHIIAFNPVVTKYTRLLLTGLGTNDPGTQLVRAEMTYVRV